ncbi:MAG: Nramp family divalent metal transporter [Planctomycetaceae bacterium]|nr:Nramp family divalent metal transporter [Planctomycetaceae bacterium]
MSELDKKDAAVATPPTSVRGILSKLGPGLIIAGSIVGSGELIATTTTGAKGGFALLWLIIIGCLIKVFVQIELGRFTITTGITSIKGLSKLPGPRLGRGNWFIWYWFIMFIFIMGQLGGIVGGVGQALSISMPITEYGIDHNEFREAETVLEVSRAQHSITSDSDTRKILQKQIIDNEIASAIAFSKLKPVNTGSLPNPENVRLLLKPLLESDLSLAERCIVEQLLPDPRLRQLTEELSRTKIGTSKPNESPAIAGLRTELSLSIDGYLRDNTREEITQHQATVASFMQYYNSALTRPAIHSSNDHNWYAAGLTLGTMALLVIGRYTFIQTFSTVMVALFTLVTIANVFGLQTMDSAIAWKIQWADIKDGLSFGLGPGQWTESLGFALATFGIIGVGAAELIAYPYWCMEHGYASFTGVRDDSEDWASRARGWIRVMKWDAWCSAAVYTFATVAFFLLGAAILGRIELIPAGDDMVRSLSVMYRPVFGPTAQFIFLFGAIAVLYSTFFVATAGNARMLSDVLRTLGWIKNSDDSYGRCVKWMCAILPAICGITYILGVKPVVAIIMSGVMQSIMLPILGGAAIYFRYKFCDNRLQPSRKSDILLVISAIGLLIAGGFAAYTKVASFLG